MLGPKPGSAPSPLGSRETGIQDGTPIPPGGPQIQIS